MDPHIETRRCSQHLRQLVVVKKMDGTVLKYAFSPLLGEFEPVECGDCPSGPTDADLSPRHAGFCPHVRKHVIVAFNNITQSAGVYLFDAAQCQFVEMVCPTCLAGRNIEMKTVAPKQMVVVVPKCDKWPSTVLMVTAQGAMSKLIFDERLGRYREAAPVEIRTLKLSAEEQAATTEEMRAREVAKAKMRENRKKMNAVFDQLCVVSKGDHWKIKQRLLWEQRIEQKSTPVGDGPHVTMDDQLLPMYLKSSTALPGETVLVAVSDVTGDVGKYVFDCLGHQLMQVDVVLSEDKIVRKNLKHVVLMASNLGFSPQLLAVKCHEESGKLLKYGVEEDGVFKEIKPVKVITKPDQIERIIAKFKEHYEPRIMMHRKAMAFYEMVKEVMIDKTPTSPGESSDEEFDFISDPFQTCMNHLSVAFPAPPPPAQQ